MKITKNQRRLLELLDHVSEHYARYLSESIGDNYELINYDEVSQKLDQIFDEDCIIDSIRKIDFGQVKLSEIKDVLKNSIELGLKKAVHEKRIEDLLKALPKGEEEKQESINKLRKVLNPNQELVDDLLKQYNEESRKSIS